MPQLHVPATSPVWLNLPYELTPAGIERLIVETGRTHDKSKVYIFEVALQDIESPDLRRRAAVLHARIESLKDVFDQAPYDDFDFAVSGGAELPKRPALDEATEDVETVLAAWEDLVSRALPVQAEWHGIRDTDKKAAEDRRRTYLAVMDGWIRHHGSDRLRLAHERKYKVSALYLAERSAQEFPGFVADAKASWEERANPTEAAIALETDTLQRASKLDERLHVRIVWLTRWVDGTEYKTNDNRPREAVIILNYLGDRTLIRPVE